ncbi:hypothetical protein C8Q80DRAFT_717981 [Daedaleopsis nitida]|nr:hypothetical protein C8Q80DRAFT_717981 [Daedaleopsis nitida]
MAMATISQSSDESQASQLLAAALRPREAPDAALIPPSDVEPHSTPLEGSLQSTTNSVHYHIHGLVATQSQSLCGGDEIDLESSQKENTPASWDKSKASSPRNPSPASSPVRTPAGPSYTSEPTETPANASPLRKDSNGKRMPKDCDVHTNDLQSPTKALKAIPFTSPSRPQARIARSPTVPVRQMLPPPKPRSPSPNSQDSFAGPLPQPDPAKAFIAQAKNFTIPLSQLGEDTQSVSDEEGPPPVASDMWPSRRRSPVLHPPSPTGRPSTVFSAD